MVEDKIIDGIKIKPLEDMGSSKRFGYGIRHVQMLCINLCIMTLFMGRSCLGVAVLAMTDASRRNDTNVEIYNWNKTTQGLILSSFFWGYMILQIPSGLLAKRYGGKIILLVALLVNAVLCLALPTLAHYGGWICVCACRMGMGLSQSCLFPASHTMLGRWLPPSERTTLSALVYGGSTVGTVIGMPLSGILAETALGWKMIFYFTAGLLLVTAFIWFWFSASSPSEHRMISVEEKDYIEIELNAGKKIMQNRPIPWRAMFRTVPLWAIVVIHFGSGVIFTMFFVDLPTYLEYAMQISLKNSAFLSALPYVGMWIGSVIFSFVCENIYNRGLLSLGTCRKIFTSIGFIGTAAGCIVLAFLTPDHKEIAVVILIATLTVYGSIHSGFMVNHLDLSPQFAGVMLSITNFVGSVGGVSIPLVTSRILNNEPTNISRWRIVFLIVAGLLVLTNTFYVFFSSADRVSWDSQEHSSRRPTIEELKPLKNIEKPDNIEKQ